LRLLRWLLATLVCLGLPAGPAAAQRGQAYCTVKDIRAEQLSNGVRVTIEADGELQWSLDIEELFRSEALKIQTGPWGEWDYFTEKFTTLPIILRNAKSGLGSAFIPIGKYPVSHAVISIPAFAAQNDGIGLHVDIVNYLGAATGERSLFIDPTEPPWEFTSEETGERYSLMIRRPDDRQGLIISWTSDRFPPPPPPKTPEDLPTELSVTGGADGITVKAVNARLQEVASAIAACTGLKIDSPPDTDLRVTCDLWNLAPDRVIDGIAAGLGLCGARLADGSWLVAADVTAPGGYAAAASRRIPLLHLRARDVLFLLPNFLVKYVQVDEAGNALTVVGPDWMVQRVAEDVAKLDAPPREVALEVAMVEYTSAAALARALHAERLIGSTAFAFDSLLGDVSFLWLPELEQGWSAVLDNLKVESAGKLRSTASLRVVNGRQGKLFAGQQRTLVFQQSDPNSGLQVSNLETVDIGTTLIVQPQLGEGDEVMLRVRMQVNSLRATDPTSGLPEIGQRSAECSIRVRDNDTIAIAGLELNDETREERKIPILGDLPLLGSLFRAPAKSRSATHLAIFVTPHIVGSGEQAAGRIVGQQFIPQRRVAAPRLSCQGDDRSG
jgi:hypothetical protein